jgi:uncharacterized protein YbjQ (UPF0145 family)
MGGGLGYTEDRLRSIFRPRFDILDIRQMKEMDPGGRLFGGNITLFTELCEKTREEAFEMMLAHAAEMGANAAIGVRYDATEMMPGVTEVLCYGTAVVDAEYRMV